VTKKQYINILILLKIEGWLLLIEAAFMLIPTLVAFGYRESDAMPFLYSVLITGVIGGALTFIRPKTKDMGKREAVLLTTLIWVVFSLFGMLPFLFSETHGSVTDAFFETISGFTSTGFSALPSVEVLPHGISIWRCITQWIGGLGIILFTLAVIPMLNYQGGMQLFKAEVANITTAKLRPRVSQTALRIWGIYIALTVVLILLLLPSNMNVFDSVCHGLTTISTGGFSTYDYSIFVYASPYIKCITCIFMFLASINFTLIYASVHGDFKPLLSNDALRWYIGAILIMAACYAGNVFLSDIPNTFENLFLDPVFQAVSILSTTGITEPDFHMWGSGAVIILLLSMFCGSCAGSTSGGVKIDRIIILFKNIRNEFYRMMHPNAIKTVIINRKGTSPQMVQKVMAFLAIYIIVILAGGMMLTFLGMDLRSSFLYTLSAITNTALGPDPTGAFGTYYHLSNLAKWILSFIMLAGRLELYTVLLIFTPIFWKN